MGIHISMEQFFYLLPIFLPILLLQAGLMIATVVNILKKNASLDKTILWLVISLVITLLGPVVYFAVGAKQLDKDASNILSKVNFGVSSVITIAVNRNMTPIPRNTLLSQSIPIKHKTTANAARSTPPAITFLHRILVTYSLYISLFV